MTRTSMHSDSASPYQHGIIMIPPSDPMVRNGRSASPRIETAGNLQAFRAIKDVFCQPDPVTSTRQHCFNPRWLAGLPGCEGAHR